jgi:Uma2 family endonuclease
MATNPKPFFTREQYLELESTGEFRNEYLNGEIIAMSGGSKPHVIITDNLTHSLRNQLDGKPCTSYSSNLRLWIPSANFYTYPDLMVSCGKEESAPGDPDSLTNPTVIVEVLSHSTERYDRGKKFGYYLRIPALRNYILVSQGEVRVDHYMIMPGGSHSFRCLQDVDDHLDITSIECSIPLRAIYRKTELAS